MKLLRILLIALLLISNTVIGQPFIFEKDDKGNIIGAFVTNSDVSATELKEVTKIKTLEQLTLGIAPEGIVLEKGAIQLLENCQQLQTLRLAKTSLSDEDLNFLPKLKSLKSLTIELVIYPDTENKPLTDKLHDVLSASDNLEHLNIRTNQTSFSDDFVRNISTHRSLTALHIHSKNFTDRALEAISYNPRLKNLEIFSPNFTDNGVQALSRIQTLAELEIGSPLLTKQSLHALKPLTGLIVLDLPIKEVDRDALMIIAGMSSMEGLILRKAIIGDDEFESLKGHPSLERLFLESSTLTIKSEGVLNSLKSLRYAQFGKSSWIEVFNKK